MHMGTTPALRRQARTFGSPPCTWGQRIGRKSAARLHPVHPHAHGDNAMYCRLAMSVPVHPHAHGDNAVAAGGSHCQRFTPMHMGTTWPFGSRATAAVHPHAHGDNSTAPLVAGRAQRFTPMHMGTTIRTCSASCGKPVHPHAHGDNAARLDRRRHGQAVHPHAHGDNTCRALIRSERHGSPPCTWGQRLCRSTSAGRFRFTPMHMGTTRNLVRSLRPPVHPHAHGDNVGRPGARGGSVSGSPPCTWGQRPARTGQL